MNTAYQPQSTVSIHPSTRVGSVHLTVNDLERQIRFYQDALGFKLHWQDNTAAGLGAGREDLLRMTENKKATRRRAAGLYHAAYLMPSRTDLAQTLFRLVETQTPLQGAADHWFSEAIYLADPEGNGIEVYRDRPRDKWPPMDEVARRGNGYFDLKRLLAEAQTEKEASDGLHPGSRLGHIHLSVPDIRTADDFYIGVLGFGEMMEYAGQAGFVSAGGYHHHIAYNIWAGRGIAPAKPGDAGLREFTIVLPDAQELESVGERADRAGVVVSRVEAGIQMCDPFGISITLTASDEAPLAR